ncbi:uncharacterized protein LOC136067946 [Quercus suber]|uniref:uncharacterized protein LOC136067946 n=1 Tax=Quercus suber TaxID=58331 RepID=UPI0032DF5AA9
MNCLVWNCCGLGNLRTGKELGDMIQAKDPFVVFLVETLADEARLDTVQQSIDYEHKWVVPKEGRGGGLVLFWKSIANLEMIDSSQYYIDTWIDRGFEHEWRFTDFYGEPPPSIRIVPPTVQKWKPPDHGLVKINCDRARFTEENRVGNGVVIRNSEGLVLGSLSKRIPQAYSPPEIEALAVTTVMELASNLGLQRAILETDSLVLVMALRDDTEFFSTVGLVLDEIRHKVNFFNELHYSHVKREGNIVAHKLARHAICVSDVVVWMGDVPVLLFPVVLADIASFS